jgi:hypothetical protein
MYLSLIGSEVSNPKLIVLVGSFGLLSNIIGLFLFHGQPSVMNIFLLLTASQSMVTAMIILTTLRSPLRPPAFTLLRTSPQHQSRLPSRFANLVLRHVVPKILVLIHHFTVTLRPQGHLLCRPPIALPEVLPLLPLIPNISTAPDPHWMRGLRTHRGLVTLLMNAIQVASSILTL